MAIKDRTNSERWCSLYLVESKLKLAAVRRRERKKKRYEKLERVKHQWSINKVDVILVVVGALSAFSQRKSREW